MDTVVKRNCSWGPLSKSDARTDMRKLRNTWSECKSMSSVELVHAQPLTTVYEKEFYSERKKQAAMRRTMSLNWHESRRVTIPGQRAFLFPDIDQFKVLKKRVPKFVQENINSRSIRYTENLFVLHVNELRRKNTKTANEFRKIVHEGIAAHDGSKSTGSTPRMSASSRISKGNNSVQHSYSVHFDLPE